MTESAHRQDALVARHVWVNYGGVTAVHGVSLRCAVGANLAIVGPNAAGKSSLLGALSGLVPHQGEIEVLGRDVSSLPAHRRLLRGLAHVPEQREVFPSMPVEDNLLVGAFRSGWGGAERAKALAEMYDLFPSLEGRKGIPAGLLSGGEQQMLAIARGLMSNPRILLLDEPTLGLAPRIVAMLKDVVRLLAERVDGLIIAEQNVEWVTEVCNDVIALERGRVVLEGTAADLREDPALRKAYGISQ